MRTKLLFPTTMGAGIFLVIAPAEGRDAAAASQIEDEEPWEERDMQESLRLPESQ